MVRERGQQEGQASARLAAASRRRAATYGDAGQPKLRRHAARGSGGWIRATQVWRVGKGVHGMKVFLLWAMFQSIQSKRNRAKKR